MAVVYDGHYSAEDQSVARRKWYITDFPHPGQLPLSQKEQYFQKLCNFTSIKSASSPGAIRRLQAQFVPYRYRNDLVEFKPNFLKE
jgi:hypothetical protein